MAMDGADPPALGSFGLYMDRAPMAVAIARGADHRLVYANLAFRELTGAGNSDIGHPIAAAFGGREPSGLIDLLGRVFRTSVAARDESFVIGGESGPRVYCAVWPHVSANGAPKHLVIEMGQSSAAELALALQREVAERMLLSALRERDAAGEAEKSSRRALFLSNESRRLVESLDEGVTRDAVARLSLPPLGAWSIVDILDDDHTMRRLRIVHPNAVKQESLRALEHQWTPQPGDLFGLPAMLRSQAPALIAARDLDAALVAGAHAAENLELLRSVGIGSLLTVPLVIRDSLLGAVTFVSDVHDRSFSSDDIALAEDLAVRSAIALSSAKLHATALALRDEAETASRAKTLFLGTMSHELRTPLNAIGGYVDLLLMGVRGTVSEDQRIDLDRIRSNQRHLLGMITDLLNFVRLGAGHVVYDIRDVAAHDAIARAASMVDALIIQKGLTRDLCSEDHDNVMRADPERVQQILINLLSNAIKFTPEGGRIVIDCEAAERTVWLRVTDTGIGIPSDRLEAIFDPFVQVKAGLASRDSGIGLGLAISRDLARAMHGDLRVESELARGSTFTLELPRALK